MPDIMDYILKLNICLIVVYIFYQFFLRRLTFYNWNRLYLLAYTALSFIIPIIDIMPSLQKRDLQQTAVMQWIPAINFAQSKPQFFFETLSYWDWAVGILIIGSVVLLIRLLMRFYSFKKMKAKAHLVSGDQIKIYQLDSPITPFSFGNAIFINADMHYGEELQKIIRHEFVHVKQKHTIDIMWCELLCIVNWFNPFVWLLRHSVKQNLEFIADSQVLQNGFDKKEYQYLLLKVMGNRQFAFTNHFNLSSLKKRIVMMNTIKSAKVHLVKFMFLLPVVAVLLLSFRKEVIKVAKLKEKEKVVVPTTDKVNMSSPLKEAFGVWKNSTIDTVPFLEKKETIGNIKLGTGTTKPLIIIDGVEMPEVKDLDAINPNDIESIEVLKDASAATLYGDKGKNGVVRVTTKGTVLTKSAIEINGKSPLYVLDGQPLKKEELKKINPNQIQSISVFKNGEAYGSNVGDGVVLITSKRDNDTISFYGKGNKVFLRNASQGQLHEIEADKIILTENGSKIVATGGVSGSTVSNTKITADTLFYSSSSNSKRTILDLTGQDSGSKIISQQRSNLPENAYYVVNGSKVKKDDIEKIDKESIKSIDVLKGDIALKYFGENAKNGAIIITTK